MFKIDALLKEVVGSRTLPALHLGVTSSTQVLYEACAGQRAYGEGGEVDGKTTFQLYSATKLVTAVAILQHVERGELDLDDIKLVHRVCPELDKQGILSGDTVVPRCGRFTLRNLMSHTSGMSYPRLNPVLGAWETRTGHLRFWTGTVDAFNKPTLFEPETAWEYGLGVDWAGIVLERVTGKSLEDIFQEDIFKPLGVDMTFYPTDDMVERLQLVVKRENGVLVRAPAIVEPRRGDIGQLAGGAGLYGTAPAYLRFLRGILASANGNGLLGEAAYKELFTNSVRFQSDSLDLLGGEQVSNDPTKHDLGRMEHSVGFPLTTVDSLHGRKAGSGSWGGAGQTLYWIDPTSDLAAVCFTQLRCDNPDPFFETYNEFERIVYDSR